MERTLKVIAFAISAWVFASLAFLAAFNAVLWSGLLATQWAAGGFAGWVAKATFDSVFGLRNR